MDFPRFVYVRGTGLKVQGGELKPQIVYNEEEYADALAAGWFPSVPEALAGETVDVGPIAVPEPVAAPEPVVIAAPEPEIRFTHDEERKRGRPRKS